MKAHTKASILKQGPVPRSSFRTVGVPLALGLVAQVAALLAPAVAQAQANSFAIATRYGEIVCSSTLAKDRKSLDVQCTNNKGTVVSAYRQLRNGTIEVLLEEGKVGQAVTKAILNSQGNG